MSGGFVLVPIGYSQQLIFRTVRCLYLWRTKKLGENGPKLDKKRILTISAKIMMLE